METNAKKYEASIERKKLINQLEDIVREATAITTRLLDAQDDNDFSDNAQVGESVYRKVSFKAMEAVRTSTEYDALLRAISEEEIRAEKEEKAKIEKQLGMIHNSDGTITYEDEHGGKFTQYVDLKNIRNSLQIDSGTVVAEYALNGKLVSLEVQGEARLSYEDEEYDIPSDFPEAVKEMLANGANLEENGVSVRYNNWFEIFWDADSDVADIEEATVGEVYILLRNVFEKYC